VRTVQLLPGIRTEPLASYLAGLGLIRVLGEQADQALTASWAPDGLTLSTTVEDIATWLADEYVPTPVLSPWNNGSGFGIKDKEPVARLKALREHASPRLDPFRHALTIAGTIMRDARGQGWADDKKHVVLEFRNRCPEELLPWIDASVVLVGDQTVFPSLLGTGGNDARTDFSTHFHKCLLEVIDTPRSLEIARDLLAGTEIERLANAAIGQFDPAGAGGPGSSKFGAADYLVNPWRYILCVEGTLLFASSAVRRNQLAAVQAAMPFTVDASPDGSPSGSAGEKSRREVWAPLWSKNLTVSEIKQLFAEARASWRGRPARRATDFYAATRTLGVARGIDQFTRYGLHQRNGQSHTAVQLDRIEVRECGDVRLAADVEDWASRFGGSDTSSAVGVAARGFQKAHLKYARDGGALQLARMLAALTTLELAVGRSGRARDNAPVRYVPAARRFLDVLSQTEHIQELRVAAGIASCRTLPGADPGTEPSRTMRQILLPVDPGDKTQRNGRWRDAPVVPGFDMRPLQDVLADVLIWRSRNALNERDRQTFRGIPGFRQGVCVPAADLHAYARSQLDEKVLDLFLRACLALDWRARDADPGWPPLMPAVPVATLGLLHPLADGFRSGQGAGGDEPRLALSPDWALRLSAGQVESVHDEAAGRLRRSGWDPVPVPPDARDLEGARVAAALVPRCLGSRSVLSIVAKQITSATESGKES
jgi:CRISPR-associated protein Csx17